MAQVRVCNACVRIFHLVCSNLEPLRAVSRVYTDVAIVSTDYWNLLKIIDGENIAASHQMHHWSEMYWSRHSRPSLVSIFSLCSTLVFITSYIIIVQSRIWHKVDYILELLLYLDGTHFRILEIISGLCRITNRTNTKSMSLEQLQWLSRSILSVCIRFLWFLTFFFPLDYRFISESAVWITRRCDWISIPRNVAHVSQLTALHSGIDSWTTFTLILGFTVCISLHESSVFLEIPTWN